MTTQQRLAEWRDKWAGALVLLVGYGLCKTLTLDSYVTAFGSVRYPMGYVSDVPFMLGASVGVLLTGVIMLLWCRRRHYLDLPYRIPIAALVVCYGVSLLPMAPSPWVLGLLGMVWGCATRLASVSFIELFARERSAVAVILQLTCALVLSAALSLVLRSAPEIVRIIVWPLAAVICCLTVRWGRNTVRLRGSLAVGPRGEEGPEAAGEGGAVDDGRLGSAVICCLTVRWGRNTVRLRGSLAVGPRGEEGPEAAGEGGAVDDGRLGSPAFGKALRVAALPVMAYMFFELVIGLINMFAYFGGSSLTIASSAPMWGMLACAAVMVTFVAATNRTPDPDSTTLVAFPIAIAVFLLLPFLGASFGPS